MAITHKYTQFFFSNLRQHLESGAIDKS